LRDRIIDDRLTIVEGRLMTENGARLSIVNSEIINL